MLNRRQLASSILWCFLACAVADADMLMPAGDLALRHDIQVLADEGVIKGPISSWPLAWDSVLSDIGKVESENALSPGAMLALARVRERSTRHPGSGEMAFRASLAGARKPSPLRSFADTPRESAELGLGVSRAGDIFTMDLNAQAVASADDGSVFRMDGSRVGVSLGNYAIAASTMERWWGPGWDGSLILSNNARPIPALSFDRTRTDPFESRWLSWLGPWDVSVLFGQMENDRTVPDARFFAFRFNFRPLPSLEIGLSRTAQWCGEGRPCDLDTFIDLLIGRDNRGGDGIGEDNEPGNQLAGFDARWTTALLDQPLAVYGQLIGEDEAGGFPSRYLAQAGMETRGTWKHRSYLLFLEVSGTSCDVLKDDINNCAYNHSIYQTGYRYRGRSVGHSADNDALIVSAGLVLQDAFDNEWSALLRSGTLNRGSFPDPRNSLTPNERDVISLDLYHNRRFRFGLVDVGVGITHFDGTASSGTQTDARLFLRWRSAR